MSRCNKGNMKGEQFLGNMHKKEIHDLDKEDKRCQIDEVIQAGHDMPFATLVMAHIGGYDNCAYCLGGSKR